MFLKLEKIIKMVIILSFGCFQASLKTLKWSLNEARALKTDKTLYFGGGGVILL